MGQKSLQVLESVVVMLLKVKEIPTNFPRPQTAKHVSEKWIRQTFCSASPLMLINDPGPCNAKEIQARSFSRQDASKILVFRRWFMLMPHTLLLPVICLCSRQSQER